MKKTLYNFIKTCERKYNAVFITVHSPHSSITYESFTVKERRVCHRSVCTHINGIYAVATETIFDFQIEELLNNMDTILTKGWNFPMMRFFNHGQGITLTVWAKQ